MRGARDMRIERVSGQQYLTIDIDRQAIARLRPQRVRRHDVIETAIGGKVATEIYEGERRFPARGALPGALPRQRRRRSATCCCTAPNGAQVPLDDVAQIEVVDGPAQISRETGQAPHRGRRQRARTATSAASSPNCSRRSISEVKLPEGYYLEWGGQFQNMERALGHLMIIVPITIAAIFFLLFLLFNSLRFATLIITVLPFASIGGIIGLFVSGEYLSVPASVGFIALWGIAVLNGVVLVSYIRSLRDDGRTAQPRRSSKARRCASGR